MLFAALLFAFWVLRLGVPVWPPPLQPRLPVGVTSLNTLVLLASAAAVGAGIRDGRGGHSVGATRGLAVGAALGALFIVIQWYEWIRLVGFGITVTSGTYGALFYAVIGMHAIHVVVALTWLLGMLAVSNRNIASLEACALYWHFVVALWPVLYVAIYLL